MPFNDTTYLNEGVVQQEHDGGKVPGRSVAAKEHLTNVTDILDFGVAHAELPAK